MVLLMIMFFVALLVMAFVLVRKKLTEVRFDRLMPFSCPRCGGGSDEDSFGRTPWYQPQLGGVWCRHCHTSFRESANGTLVEDRDF